MANIFFQDLKSATQAFSKNTLSGGYAYAGDANQRILQIGENRQIADGDPGINVFGAPANSPLPAAGANANIFEAIGRFAADLRSNTPNPASLDDVASALDKMLTVEASIGARLKCLG